MLGSSLIAWHSKKQSVVSRSTAEALYRALATVTCELIWLVALLKDFHFSVPQPITVFCDNLAAIDIASNPVHHSKTKHIELDCHFIREKVQAHFITPTYIPSRLQLADIFTKPLGKVPHWFLLAKLGVHNICAPPTCGGSIAGNSNTSTLVDTSTLVASASTHEQQQQNTQQQRSTHRQIQHKLAQGLQQIASMDFVLWD